MPAITITLAQLDALRPCAKRRDALVSAIDWSTPVDAAKAVAAGATLDDIAWVASALSRRDPDVERRLRLWMADCAARVLHIFEREHPTDMRPREAIVAARRYARGEIDAAACVAAWDAACDTAGAARDAACDAAWAAAWAAGGDAWDAGDAAGAAAWAVARAAWGAAASRARDAARAARAAAWATATSRARDAAGAARAARAAEERWQLDRLVARLSDEEPEDWPLPTPPAQDAA